MLWAVLTEGREEGKGWRGKEEERKGKGREGKGREGKGREGGRRKRKEGYDITIEFKLLFFEPEVQDKVL